MYVCPGGIVSYCPWDLLLDLQVLQNQVRPQLCHFCACTVRPHVGSHVSLQFEYERTLVQTCVLVLYHSHKGAECTGRCSAVAWIAMGVMLHLQ